MKTKRTDPHRPGAIIPADYQHVLDFAFGGSDGFPPYNVDLMLKTEAGRHVHIERDSGGCDVCGAHYRYGALFLHTPSGDYVRMGHECARKYELLADFVEFDAKFEAHKRAHAAQVEAERNRQHREAFLNANDGLRESLACGHRITNDLSAKLVQYHSLSPAQISLAHKLHSELWCPERPSEINVPAPEGRQVIRGTVVSCKTYESDFGTSLKMTVKVKTDAGTWLCWGTVPSNVEGYRDGHETGLKGRQIEFKATLKKGREAHFALFSRPTNARVTDAVPAPELEPRLGVAGVVCAQMNAGAR